MQANFGLMDCTDISLKKIYEWQIIKRKDAEHNWSLKKCSLELQ